MRNLSVTQNRLFTYAVLVLAGLVWTRNIQLLLDLLPPRTVPEKPDMSSLEIENMRPDDLQVVASKIEVGHDPFQQEIKQRSTSVEANDSNPDPDERDFDWSNLRLVGIVDHTALIQEADGETRLLKMEDSLHVGRLVGVMADSVEIQYEGGSIILQFERQEIPER